MRISSVTPLGIPSVQVIRYERFPDTRGYFSETFRKGDLWGQLEEGILGGNDLVQCNESYSLAGTVRGLHFQWNPYLGKLVRTLSGHMVDIVVDIRIGSPTFGKGLFYDMAASPEKRYGEWIWIPPGFAHGNYYLADSVIEYFCTGQYNPQCEAGLSPLATDIDWSLSDRGLLNQFFQTVKITKLMSEKDRNGLSLADWVKDSRSNFFVFSKHKIPSTQ